MKLVWALVCAINLAWALVCVLVCARNWYICSYVLKNSYVLQNSYVHSYVLPSMCLKKNVPKPGTPSSLTWAPQRRLAFGHHKRVGSALLTQSYLTKDLHCRWRLPLPAAIVGDSRALCRKFRIDLSTGKPMFNTFFYGFE